MEAFNIGVFHIKVTPTLVHVIDTKHGTSWEKEGTFNVDYETASDAVLEACKSKMNKLKKDPFNTFFVPRLPKKKRTFF